MNMNKTYKELTGNKFQNLNVTPDAFIPTPTDNDYNRGYITRYFTQKVNDSNSSIFEVSDIEYSRLSQSVMFITTRLRWRIVGPIETVYDDNGKVIDMGIRESNKKSINLESTNIPNLKLYLPNLVQFIQK